jgi:photosystem II stability/assembly factor-like uncharacterized protein
MRWHDRRFVGAMVVVGIVVVAAAIVVPLELVGTPPPASSGRTGPSTPSTTAARATTTTTEAGTTATRTGPPAPTLPTVWTQRTVPAGVKGPLYAVTCPTPTSCYAVGGSFAGTGSASIIASSDGGTSWTLTYSTPGSLLSTIACGDATRCVAVGATDDLNHPLLVYTTDGGRQWSKGMLPGGLSLLDSVACASVTVCLAAGNHTLLRSTDGGARWAAVSVPSALSGITTVVCPSSTVCFVAGSGTGPESSSPSVVAKSPNAGATWTAPTVLDHPSGFAQLACVDTDDCAGIIGSGATTSEGQGSAASTDDGGTTWSISGAAIGGSVACSPTMCLSVGGFPHGTTPNRPRWYVTASVSTTAGRTWTTVAVPSYQGTFHGASCDSADNCVVVGGGTDGTQTTAPAVIMTYGH